LQLVFRRLREQKINAFDDGMVVAHMNLDESGGGKSLGVPDKPFVRGVIIPQMN
jgi:hypothetical protein